MSGESLMRVLLIALILPFIMSLTPVPTTPSLVETLKEQGYLPMSRLSHAPEVLSSSIVGALVGGGPERPTFIAPSSICFSAAEFRKVESIKSKERGNIFQIAPEELNTFVNILRGSEPSINTGHDFFRVKSILVEFDGYTKESLIPEKLAEHYNTKIPEVCRQYFNVVGFVVEALFVDRMKITLLDECGSPLVLSKGEMKRYVHIPQGVRYSIKNDTSVSILSSKVLAYKMGRIRSDDHEMGLYETSKVLQNKFVFKKSLAIPQEDSSNSNSDKDGVMNTESNSNNNNDDVIRDLDQNDLVDLYSTIE
jgi:hypothetical protein